MISRRIIALLATTGALPPAGASECMWPGDPETAATAAQPAPGAEASESEERPVQVRSGHAEMTREGDAKLSGGVTILQGEREVSADAATYDASERRFKVEGDVEYRSPDLRLKGGSGSWNALGTGQFTGAEFELPQRPARGSAESLEMDNEGKLRLSEVRFTTCPAGNTDWELRASRSRSTRRRSKARGGTCASTSRACRSSTRR